MQPELEGSGEIDWRQYLGAGFAGAVLVLADVSMRSCENPFTVVQDHLEVIERELQSRTRAGMGLPTIPDVHIYIDSPESFEPGATPRIDPSDL